MKKGIIQPGMASLLFFVLTSTLLYGQSAQETNSATTDGSTNAASFSVVLSRDGSIIDSATVGDDVALTGYLNPDPADLGAGADIYVVIRTSAGIMMRTNEGNYAAWDLKLANLVPYLEDVILGDNFEVDVFTGPLGDSGFFRVYLGYMKAGSDALVYTPKAARFEISNASIFYTPAPIADVLQLTRVVSWPELGDDPTDLTRFSLGPSGTDDIVILKDGIGQVDANLSLAEGLADQASATDELLLRTMFKFIEESDGGFRIVSTKHSNYALDMDDDNSDLILRDVRSGDRDDETASYLVFNTSGSGNAVILNTVGRKLYDSQFGEFITDSSWMARELTVASGTLFLSNSAGTAMTLYSPPIDFDIPFDLNPLGISRVDNEEVTPIVVHVEDNVADTPNQVVPAYADQVAASGDDSGTTAAATAMLADIESTLAAEDAQLRYPAEFYLAFRNGLLSRIVQSSDSTDGVIGQLSVPYVYFTNEADDDGIHHPFMVIASYGVPDSLALLWDVPKPPGADCDDGACDPMDYSTQPVTRSFHREAFLMKIPLRDYGEVESLTENIMVNDLASDVGVTLFDHHNFASVSATGVAVDGVIIYPTYNNSLHVSQSAAELSAHGMHSGRGLGVHYHADAYSPTHDGLNFYNDNDYIGHTHPPIISIGFDGVAGYGIYREDDSTSEGVAIPLDDFGGHEHGVYGYHYHSFTADEIVEEGGPQPQQVSYTAHKLPPLGAWAGRINGIPEFWQGPAPNYVGGRSKFLGTDE